jgi:hypothetical protein
MLSKRKYLLLGLAFIVCCVFLTNQASAQECRIIRLYATALPVPQKVSLEPQILQIKKGGCVIWANWVRSPQELEIIFQEGKICKDMTESPTGFTLDGQNCYVTSFVEMGKTSSLVFVEEGTFKYVARLGTGTAFTEASGKIIVE